MCSVSTIFNINFMSLHHAEILNAEDEWLFQTFPCTAPSVELSKFVSKQMSSVLYLMISDLHAD